MVSIFRPILRLATTKQSRLPPYVPLLSSRARILYVDNHLIAVDKPPNILAQPDITGHLSLPTAIEEFLVHNLGKPGKAYVGVLQRLDKPCSGVTLFARTQKAASRMAEAFRVGGINKLYLAAVSPPPIKNSDVLSPPRQDESPLAFHVIHRVKKEAAVLALSIETGKKHQVRRTLAAHGFPIIGDELHGSTLKVPAGCRRGSVMLHAAQLKFTHPVTKRSVRIRCFPPWPRPFLPKTFGGGELDEVKANASQLKLKLARPRFLKRSSTANLERNDDKKKHSRVKLLGRREYLKTQDLKSKSSELSEKKVLAERSRINSSDKNQSSSNVKKTKMINNSL